jgi:hypothetical protein
MSDTPDTNALLDRVDAAMKLIEITRRERDEARKDAARWRDAWLNENRMSLINSKFPWEEKE